MSTTIPNNILSLKGQRVNQIRHDPDINQVHILWYRDRRLKVIGPVTGYKGTVNQYIRRKVTGLPLFGYPSVIDIKLAQVWVSNNERRLEKCGFVDYGLSLLAEQSPMHYLRRFAKSLRKHAIGICNYAKHKITSARIEAGNVSIGMIRKLARGIKETEYFKLKIRQSSLPDN